MNNTTYIIIAVLVGAGIGYMLRGGTPPQTSQPQEETIAEAEDTPSSKDSNQTKIEEALSAGPETLTKDAMVMDYPEKEGAEPKELKKGTNEWTCMPDLPSSPGKDPMCLDKTGMEWLNAYITKATPALTQVGLAYMLAGGSDASNTDPFAEKPTEGDDWVSTPAHTMIFPVGKLDAAVYGTDPKKGGPWIMWAGTPYEHLMVPVE